MASIRNFPRPGRETLLAHPRESRIFVGAALGIDNLCGFALIVTLILNSMITFFTQPMPPKALCSRPSTGKNEYLTILGNY